MIAIPSNNSVYFDIDSTLVYWRPPQERLEREGITITYPGALMLDHRGILPTACKQGKILPHYKHIEQLKRHKLRGHPVIVWSAGGWEWAETVVRALKLEDYVDLCLSKPSWVYDDKKVEEFMPPSKWFKDEEADTEDLI